MSFKQNFRRRLTGILELDSSYEKYELELRSTLVTFIQGRISVGATVVV